MAMIMLVVAEPGPPQFHVARPPLSPDIFPCSNCHGGMTPNETVRAVADAGGGNAWSALSDRNAKENFQPVDPQAVLEKVAADYADKGVVLAKVNVDEEQFIAAQFQVRSIPTVYAVFQGQPVADLETRIAALSHADHGTVGRAQLFVGAVIGRALAQEHRKVFGTQVLRKAGLVAAPHVDTVMPGFTHMQVAQPVSFAHHLLAYVEMFARDAERLADVRRRTNRLPLGAAALAGTSYPLDRERVARMRAIVSGAISNPSGSKRARKRGTAPGLTGTWRPTLTCAARVSPGLKPRAGWKKRRCESR